MSGKWKASENPCSTLWCVYDQQGNYLFSSPPDQAKLLVDALNQRDRFALALLGIETASVSHEHCVLTARAALQDTT